MKDVLRVRPLNGDRQRIEAMASALADAVDAKGRYHPSHCHSVARLAQVIGAHMGFTGDALFRLRTAGLLHDVGKLRVPDSILLKPDRLTDNEFEAMKRHPVEAHEKIIAAELHDEARWVLHHHERPDGQGYPSGLMGAAIPLGSCIIGVADAFDVMVSHRTYKRAMTRQHAMSELRAHVGTQFNGDVVDALDRALNHGQSLVRTVRGTRG